MQILTLLALATSSHITCTVHLLKNDIIRLEDWGMGMERMGKWIGTVHFWRNGNGMKISDGQEWKYVVG